MPDNIPGVCCGQERRTEVTELRRDRSHRGVFSGQVFVNRPPSRAVNPMLYCVIKQGFGHEKNCLSRMGVSGLGFGRWREVVPEKFFAVKALATLSPPQKAQGFGTAAIGCFDPGAASYQISGTIPLSMAVCSVPTVLVATVIPTRIRCMNWCLWREAVCFFHNHEDRYAVRNTMGLQERVSD